MKRIKVWLIFFTLVIGIIRLVAYADIYVVVAAIKITSPPGSSGSETLSGGEAIRFLIQAA
jgi:hypothetical protein